MAEIIFITGGVASGKSSYACKLAEQYKKVIFIATAEALDKEMIEKIAKHKATRPKSWKIIESGNSILEKVIDLETDGDVCVVDCLTMYVSNLLVNLKNKKDDILKSVTIFTEKMRQDQKIKKYIIVSNEVGWGIVPANKLARDFREILGAVNKQVAEVADKVYLQVSGISIKIK